MAAAGVSKWVPPAGLLEYDRSTAQVSPQYQGQKGVEKIKVMLTCCAAHTVLGKIMFVIVLFNPHNFVLEVV